MLSDDAYVEPVLRALRAAADPVRAEAMAAYMRRQFPFFGVPTPPREAIQRAAWGELPRPHPDEVAAAARRLWAVPEREAQYAACDLVRRHAKRCPASFLDVLDELITTRSWWDTVDALAHPVGRLVTDHPELVAVMDRWIDDRNLWRARVALLHQLDYRERTDAPRLFAYCLRRAGDREFFLRKAIGWALRQHSKTDPAAVAAFVAEHDAVLSPLSRREALKAIERQARRAATGEGGGDRS